MKKIIVGFILLSGISLLAYSCGSNCSNCGGDGWVEVYGVKTACPKCDNVRE
jgi:hypothetical protein